MKVGDLVLVRPNVSGWSNQAGEIIDVQPERGLFLLRFRDKAELWFMRKELVRG